MLTQIKVKDIVPDDNQPRKYFDAAKMRSLENSIKQEGISVPLIVQDIGGGKYLLVDGERRYRTALKIGLKEVPAVIEKQTKDTERMVRQFHIQEQHEGWTPLEKANALNTLAKDLGLTLDEVCKLVGATTVDTYRYKNFALLADKANYVRNEIPLDYAAAFLALSNFLKSLYINKLNRDFQISDQKKIEARLIEMVKSGAIINRTDISRLKDAFIQNPKVVDVFLKDKNATPTKLFLETGARGAYHLRNVMNNAGFLSTHINRFLDKKDVKVTEDQIQKLKNVRATIDKFLDLVE